MEQLNRAAVKGLGPTQGNVSRAGAQNMDELGVDFHSEGGALPMYELSFNWVLYIKGLFFVKSVQHLLIKIFEFALLIDLGKG